jgi:hypothetical protein
MSCLICCEKFNKSTHLRVDCKGCDDSSDVVCRTCSQTFILNSINNPHCMLCKSEWEREFMTTYLTKTFVNNKLKTHTEEIFMDREISKLPDTQEYVQHLKHIDRSKNLIQDCVTEKNKLLRLLKKQTDMERDLRYELNALYIDTPEDTKGRTEKKFTYKCPGGDCKGFLSEKWACGLCDVKYCKDCMEPNDEDHECDKERKETFQLIKKDTKPCPKCGELIFKLDGCNQMWCTVCHTTFDWITGKTEDGAVHNPEYYRWVREGGRTLARNPLDVPPRDPCGLIDQRDLLYLMRNIFKPKQNGLRNHVVDCPETVIIFNIHRMINHIGFKCRDHTTRHDIDNRQLRDLRAKYLLNTLNKETWKRQLQIIEKSNKKKQDYINIWNLIRIILNESVAKIVQLNTTTSVIDVMAEVEAARLFCNKSFAKVGQLYTCVYPGIDSSWNEQLNWAAYCKRLKK